MTVSWTVDRLLAHVVLTIEGEFRVDSFDGFIRALLNERVEDYRVTLHAQGALIPSASVILAAIVQVTQQATSVTSLDELYGEESRRQSASFPAGCVSALTLIRILRRLHGVRLWLDEVGLEKSPLAAPASPARISGAAASDPGITKTCRPELCVKSEATLGSLGRSIADDAEASGRRHHHAMHGPRGVPGQRLT